MLPSDQCSCVTAEDRLRHQYVINAVFFPGQTMMTPNMQGIIMAIGKARSVYDKSGPEAAFFKVLLCSTVYPNSCKHMLQTAGVSR